MTLRYLFCAIPPGAARRGQTGDDCPDAYGGPYYLWQYSHAGPLEPVFTFSPRDDIMIPSTNGIMI